MHDAITAKLNEIFMQSASGYLMLAMLRNKRVLAQQLEQQQFVTTFSLIFFLFFFFGDQAKWPKSVAKICLFDLFALLTVGCCCCCCYCCCCSYWSFKEVGKLLTQLTKQKTGSDIPLWFAMEMRQIERGNALEKI